MRPGRLGLLLLILAASGPRGQAAAPPERTAVTPLGFSDQAYEAQKAQESSVWDQTNPVKFYLALLIRGYQMLFSSLDGSTCQFRPSCSHYGSQAVKQCGPLQGALMAGDRLLRCNPFTVGHYHPAPDQMHLIDSVGEHALW